MKVAEHVPLAKLTTFKIGGPAALVAECETIEDIKTAVALARDRGLPIYPLGEGSNVLAADAPIEKLILRLTRAAHAFETVDDASVRVVADAGMHWDALVDAACAAQLWGLENLAGIPGSVGAAPVQNIGAYGREARDTLEWVEAYDLASSEVKRFTNAACRFGYRESRFKREPDLLILRVAFLLSRVPEPRVGYQDLQKAAAEGRSLATSAAIAAAVREIRSHKFPDLAAWGTAGSFFKNPFLDEEAAARLAERFPGLPQFPGPEGTKIPLAWLLDHALGLRGFAEGAARLYEQHALVVVTAQGAHARDVDALADAVTRKILDIAGIRIEREVRTLA